MNMINALTMATLLIVASAPYPLDEELKSSFSGTCHVEMSCKVIKTGDVYTYMYSVKNKGDKSIRFKWDIINQAMCFGHNLELMIDLDPDENAIFTLQHPDPPIQVRGRATAFYLTTNSKVEMLVKQTPELPKGIKIDISKQKVYNSESGAGHGALPKSFVHPPGTSK